ncbi:MAG: hypothetical protein II578_01990 [Bacteroidaceae bacterium]|nr:hypothetical protein [Bacteroidaceae bacterium]
MSDGNFNRALLPSTPYRSGVRMGQQQMRAQAIEAFRAWAKSQNAALTDAELEAMTNDFRRHLPSADK